MSVTTSSQINMDSLIAALPAGVTKVQVEGVPITTAGSKVITVDGGVSDATLQTAVTTAAGQFVDRTANQSALQTKMQAALAANVNDVAQDQTIQSGAVTINGTAGPFTLAQCTTFIKQLAQAVNTLAGNDINAKKELQALVRLVLQQFDSTAGT